MKHDRLTTLVFLAALSCGPALAGPREDMLAGIARCGVIADDRAYLDCVNGQTQIMRAQIGSAPVAHYAPAQPVRPVQAYAQSYPQPATVPTPPPPKKKGFFSHLFGGQTPSGLRMASYSFDSHGMFTVTLSDGEVWRQMGNDIHYAHWKEPASHYGVTVVEGTFGGTKLMVDGETDGYVVQRIR